MVKNRLKRLFFALLIAPLFWTTSIAPADAWLVQPAYNFQEWGNDVLFANAGFSLSSLVLGTVVAYLRFTDPTTPATQPMVVQLNPKAKLAVPGGWSPSASGVVQPTPPSVGTTHTQWNMSSWSVSNQTTPLAACIAAKANGLNIPGTVGVSFQNSALYYCTSNGSGNYGSVTASYSCDAGYTLSGSTCNLTTASSVVKPVQGVDTFMRTSNSFARDPQQSPSDATLAALNAFSAPATGQLQFSNPNTGQSTAVVVNQSDGTTTITTTVPNSDGITSTQYVTKFSAPDATTGQTTVVGQSQSQVNGQGALAGSTSYQSPSTGTTDVSNLATHSDISQVGAKVDSASAQAHTDAQQAHADQAATQAGQCGGVSASGSPQPKCGVDFGTAEAGTDTFASSLSGFVTSVESSPIFSQPANFFTVSVGGSCPVWTFSGVNGGIFQFPAFTIDQQCSSVMESIWPWISAVIKLAAAFLAFRWAFL